jgi:hypothetical protein
VRSAAIAGLVGVLVLLYVRRTEEPAVDPPAREFERQLDILSGEYPVLRDDDEPPSGRGEPPEQGRRRA